MLGLWSVKQVFLILKMCLINFEFIYSHIQSEKHLSKPSKAKLFKIQ